MGEENHHLHLRPDKQIQKILLSTPADFVDEFKGPGLLITHAWPPLSTGRPKWFKANADSLSRTPIILAFNTPAPPPPAPGIALPNYEEAGDFVASTLSVLFGKRFDVHGPIEMAGYYHVPDLQALDAPANRRLRHNDNRPRADRPIPLDLSQISRFVDLIQNSNHHPRSIAFHSAAKFYRRALITVEFDAEIAYLNLITAGEIISHAYKLPEDAELDSETRNLLANIADVMPDGLRVVKILRKKLLGVKRRFVTAITAMVADSFFATTEAEDTWGAFRRDGFARRIGAAYDLRSQFVHAGTPFGRWVSLHMPNYEVPMGKPVLADAEMAKILSRAPLFNGLERIVRHVLLTFAIELGAKVDDVASGETADPPS